MIKLKSVLFAAMVSSISTLAMADCREQRSSYFPDQNDAVTFTAFLAGPGACMHEFRSPIGFEFTGASIATRPSNGTLSKLGPNSFMYKPKPGAKGRDQYAVKVCGNSRAGSGCSLINFDTMVH